MDLRITRINASCSIRKLQTSRHSKMGAGLRDLDESMAVTNVCRPNFGKNALRRLTISAAKMKQDNSNSMRHVLGFDSTKLLEEFDRSVNITDVLHDKPFKFGDHWDSVMISSQGLSEE